MIERAMTDDKPKTYSPAKLRFALLYAASIAIVVFIINRVLLGTDAQSAFMWAGMFAALGFTVGWRQATQRRL